MTNLNQKTLDWLLDYSDWIKARAKLTQRGRDLVNEELSAIEWELDSRKSDCEFQTLLGDWLGFADIWTREVVGFEPIYGKVN